MVMSQQQIETLMVSALSFSVFAQAMAIMLGAMEVVPVAAGVPVPEAAIVDLRTTFGVDIVDIAIKNVGKEDVLLLAREVERLTIEDMNKRYGEYATTAALAAAPPGELKVAKEIARIIAGQGVTEATPFVRKEAVMETAKRRGRQAAQPQKDTKTGIVYRSKAAAGMAVAGEYGLDATNTFIWYEVIKMDPKRFVPA